MKAYIYHSGHTPYVKNLINELSNHLTVSDKFDESCDVGISLQMGNHQKLISTIEHLQIPFFTYVWDCYEWIWDHGRGYDWDGYGELCKVSKEIWTPSTGQCMRLKQHWNISYDKSEIIHAYAPLFEYEDVRDEGYVCNPLRTIPDRHRGWLEKVCASVGVKYRHGGRGAGSAGLSVEEYRKFIAHSSFIICPWYEASTGGMSLVEGYYLGKEVLVCNSPYMGATEYFGDRANYFEPTFDSMKEKVKLMWEQRYTFPSRPIEEKKEFCKNNFSIEVMAKKIYERIVWNTTNS